MLKPNNFFFHFSHYLWKFIVIILHFFCIHRLRCFHEGRFCSICNFQSFEFQTSTRYLVTYRTPRIFLNSQILYFVLHSFLCRLADFAHMRICWQCLHFSCLWCCLKRTNFILQYWHTLLGSSCDSTCILRALTEPKPFWHFMDTACFWHRAFEPRENWSCFWIWSCSCTLST